MTPQGEIDKLIADYGLRKILLVLAARLIRRLRPPDNKKQPAGGDTIPNYLRKDLGLPPEPPPRLVIDLVQLNKDRLW